jgi:hypothetical protein
MDGLLLALLDWSGELRILKTEREKPPGLNPAAAGRHYSNQALIE